MAAAIQQVATLCKEGEIKLKLSSDNGAATDLRQKLRFVVYMVARDGLLLTGLKRWGSVLLLLLLLPKSE